MNYIAFIYRLCFIKYKCIYTATTYYLQVSEYHIHTLPIDTHVYEVLSKYIQHAKDGLY